MRHRGEVPAARPRRFPGVVFTPDELVRSDAPLWHLRDPALVTATRGVRRVGRPSTTRERAEVVARVLRHGQVFSHVTAAVLWGLPLPRPLEDRVALDVIGPTGKAVVRRRGCIGHLGVEVRETDIAAGVPVTGLADTWVDLGSVHARPLTVDDLVVAGDAALARGVSTDALRAALDRRGRVQGAGRLRQALDLVRPGVRSPMESRTRLVVVRAGFPHPRVNAAVHDRHGGWLLEGDLVWDAERVIVEYQGEVHGGIGARSADAHRRGLAEAEGWVVIEVFAADHTSATRRDLFLRRLHLALTRSIPAP